jgi:PAS domain-containing protein
VFECDAQGRCIFVNQRLARFFRKSIQSLLGTPMVELLGDGTDKGRARR